MNNILVFAELLENEVTDLSLQCLTRARELADAQGAKVHCVVIGSQVDAVCDTPARYGADHVWSADDAQLKNYSAPSYERLVAECARDVAPELILFPSSTQGNDCAATLATTLNAACVLECKDVQCAGTTLTLTRTEFDGKVLTSFTAVPGATVVATQRDGSVEVKENKKTPARTKLQVTLTGAEHAARVISQEIAKKTVDLKAAKIIVTAGAGVGSKENFKVIEDLAQALGGEIAATRPVVDAGWATPDRQVGQTGATVRPDLYIACGVSGAVQHRVGMMDAKTIIAINTDASAPIFKIANYCIVGDLNAVLPKLTKLLK